MTSDDVAEFPKERISKNILVFCEFERNISLGDNLCTYNGKEGAVERKSSNILCSTGGATKLFKYLDSKLRGLL